jgi:hypothetical protein
VKIYNYIKINMVDNSIIEEDSFEYDGEIFECKGGSVKVPPPTPEEKEIQKEILDQLKESRELQKQFLPLLLQTAGYKYDDEGNLIKMGYDEYLDSLDPAMRLQYENLQLIQEQANKALSGEFENSAALEKNIANQKLNLEEDLVRRLGSQWGQTSAGLTAIQNFEKNAEILREQEREAAINRYGGLGLQTNQSYLNNQQIKTGMASGLSSYGTNLIPSYSSVLQPYQNQRNLQLQANMQNTSRNDALWSGLGQTAGMLGVLAL